MTTRSFITGVLLAGIMLISCQKVIDIKTDKAAAKYVIEGNLSDFANDCQVRITKLVNFSESNVPPVVTNAVVTIEEDGSRKTELLQTSPGVYESQVLRARAGSTYRLLVQIGTETFTSTVQVPEKVPFDSLYVADFYGFGRTRKLAYVTFQDPPGVKNYYRFIQYKSSIKNSNLFILNDEFSDGRKINTFLIYFDTSDNQRIDAGDIITVEMQCIAPSVYTFFSSLSQNSTGGNESVAPDNPVSNTTGGAIGYFNAFIKQQKTVIAE